MDSVDPGLTVTVTSDEQPLATADAGWQVAVRADFDAAGIAHVRAVLAATPRAQVWRMSPADHKQVFAGGSNVPLGDVPDTPWDPALADETRATAVVAFEEALLPELLDDLSVGRPDH